MNYDESITNPRVTSVAGATIEHAVLVLGVVMTALFLVLWVTSFDSVRRKMGAKKWKSCQRWSYGLYAMLFIHSVGLQVGGLMSYNAKAALAKPKTEMVANTKSETAQHSNKASMQQPQKAEDGNRKVSAEAKEVEQKSSKATAKKSSRPKRFSFADVSVPRNCRAIINIIIYILVYGSYLYFRIRKSKTDKKRRLSRK